MHQPYHDLKIVVNQPAVDDSKSSLLTTSLCSSHRGQIAPTGQLLSSMPPRKSHKLVKSKPQQPRQKAQVPTTANTNTSSISIDLQQLELNVFRNALPDAFTTDLESKLQAVKTALFNRDFAGAFGTVENLTAYATRWSPSRALAYTQVFEEALPLLGPNIPVTSTPNESVQSSPFRMTCLGGGAGAELVAAGAILRHLKDNPQSQTMPLDKITLKAVDIAPWTNTLEQLHKSIVNPPPLSKYASAQALANSKPLTAPETLDFEFEQRDILGAASDVEAHEFFGNVDLVTVFFTMNELFSTSIAKTNTLLLRLKNAMQIGSFLLVVDSAGSYATVTLNGGEKTYPMQWLLDHTMLSNDIATATKQKSADDTSDSTTTWTKMRTEESTWFRLPEGLKYPLELEDMRYQLHLYSKQSIS